MSEKLTKFHEEITPLSGGELLHAPADQLSSAEAVTAFAVVKHIESAVKERRTELRKRVLNDPAIITSGKSTPSGGTTTSVVGSKVQRKKSVKKFAKESQIRQVMAAKGIAEEQIFDSKRVTYIEQVVNPSKIQHLLEIGVLSQAEVDSFHSETWTLVVTPSEKISKLLEVADERASEQRKLLDFSNPPEDS